MPNLYLITDPILYPNFSDLLLFIENNLINKIKLIQYRNKYNNFIKSCEEAEKLKNLCDKYYVPLIINDRIDVAKEIGAHGVHLGREDENIIKARQILGKNARIGVSCYGDISRAEMMLKAGADDLAFGAVFPSKTKPNAPRVPHEILKKARQQFASNLIAIGGITLQNIDALHAEINFDYYAMISGLLTPTELT